MLAHLTIEAMRVLALERFVLDQSLPLTWDVDCPTLAPREQAKRLRRIVARIDYDGTSRQVAIKRKPPFRRTRGWQTWIIWISYHGASVPSKTDKLLDTSDCSFRIRANRNPSLTLFAVTLLHPILFRS
jgi:hypothetical protein